jgi:hypothetical protein
VRRRTAGHKGPLVYFSQSRWQTVHQAFVNQGVPEPGYICAAYPGTGPVIPPGYVGHQYEDAGTYDISVVVDYLPGIDPTPVPPTPTPPKPKPVPPPPKEDQMIAIAVDTQGRKHVAFIGKEGTPYADHVFVTSETSQAKGGWSTIDTTQEVVANYGDTYLAATS